MTNFVSILRNWLSSTYSIRVPDNWLEACVEWIQEENQGASVAIEALKNQVYQQWLMSDLRELRTASLPTEISDSRKVEINGSFAVQIDSALDVGCSFYSQTQKFKGTENPNALVSADEPKQPAWEPKPSRMILLKLTDGVQDVKAMEYKHIPALVPFITPGSKMLIRGPVLCRRGMLMLGPNNVQILGGEVDSLMETNTPVAVLTSAMQECQANNGKSERQEFSGRMITKGDDKKFMSVNQPSGAPTIKHENRKREPLSQVTQNRSTAPNTGNSNTRSNVKNETADPDFEDDFDYDALMADMENEPAPGPKGDNSIRRIKQEPISQRQLPPPVSRTCPQQTANTVRDDDFMDDFDDDFDVHTVEQQLKTEPQSQNISARDGSHYERQNKSATTSSNNGPSNSYTSVVPNKKKTFTSHSTACSNQKKQDPGSRRSANYFDDDFDDDFDFEPVRNPKPAKMMKTENHLNPQNQNSSTNRSFGSEGPHTGLKVPKAVIHPFSPGTSSNTTMNTNSNNTKSNRASLPGTSLQLQTSCNNPVRSGMMQFDNSTITVNINGSSGPGSAQKKQGQARMDRFLGGPLDTSRSPRHSTETPVTQPFTYLSTVLGTMAATQTSEVMVKGYISTLTSKLTSNQGRLWSLACKINDGTASLNVDLSNSVLTKLIGFSAEDSMVMKQRSKVDPSVKEVLAEGLQQCQQALTDLSSLMKIQFKPGQVKPVVTELIPVSAAHVRFLLQKLTER